VHHDQVDAAHGHGQDQQLRQQGASCVMNCGSTATMKMMPLGLVALVRKPVRSAFYGRHGTSAWAAAPLMLTLARHWLRPR
jgi:hypothetical protein